MLIDESDYLVHHGVKGMQWGVRKEDVRSALNVTPRKERAKVNEAKAELLQTKIDTLLDKKGPVRNREAKLVKLADKRDKQDAKANAKREGKLTPNQKKALIGAGITAAVLGTYGAYKLADIGQLNKLGLQGSAFIHGKDIFNKDERLASKDFNLAEIKIAVVSKINPNYGMPGTKNNCRRATFAYEMRRRGYDVKATKTISGSGQTPGGLVRAISDEKFPTMVPGVLTRAVQEKRGKKYKTSVFDPFSSGSSLGKKVIDIASGKSHSGAIFKALSSEPNGARGELGVMWGSGGAHSMAWEIINGKPVIIDAQSGDVYDSPAALEKHGFSLAQAAYTRLDNIPLNNRHLMRWLSNANAG